MYAVIKTGGKQYKVSPGDVIEVEHLKTEQDGELTLTPLLVVTDNSETVSGSDRLSEFPVSAKILGEKKGDKVTVFKYRPKSGYASKNGHRQLYSLIQITAIGAVKTSELKTAEDVQPETTGPQKPAPVEKAEPETEPGAPAEAIASSGHSATAEAAESGALGGDSASTEPSVSAEPSPSPAQNASTDQTASTDQNASGNVEGSSGTKTPEDEANQGGGSS